MTQMNGVIKLNEFFEMVEEVCTDPKNEVLISSAYEYFTT